MIDEHGLVTKEFRLASDFRKKRDEILVLTCRTNELLHKLEAYRLSQGFDQTVFINTIYEKWFLLLPGLNNASEIMEQCGSFFTHLNTAFY